MFRDEGNYKLFGRVCFSNPQQASLGTIQYLIKTALIDYMYFYPQEWKVPLLSDNYLTMTETDWCEFESVEVTTEMGIFGSVTEWIEGIRGS
jgi:hypothetical protein